MQNWDLNEKTGDYLMEGGAPKQTDSLRIPAYMRLKVRRRGWLYAPDVKYGSDFWTVKKRQTSRDTTAIENTAARALQPIVDDGRASFVLVDNDGIARSGVGVKCKIVAASGREDQLNLQGLGV
jgi:phage gp46-like protein